MTPTRPLAVAVVASLALGASGCQRLQSEEGKAKAIVEDYLKAATDGDGETACLKVTESTKKNLERGGRSCADTISSLSSGPGKSVLEAFKDAEVENVEVNGDRGMADIKVKGLTQKINLRKENGAWKVESTKVAA